MPSDRILLGRITGAHGIRGEVVLRSYAAVPADIAAYGPLGDEAGARSFQLKVVRVSDKGVIARVAGVTDRNGAEALAGTDLYVARARLPKAAEGEYYHADLIGLAAVSPDGAAIGEVVAVQNYGAGDLLEIRLAGSPKTELVPFKNAFVPTVDLVQRRVVVVMPVAAADDEEDDRKVTDDGKGGA